MWSPAKKKRVRKECVQTIKEMRGCSGYTLGQKDIAYKDVTSNVNT
jgi:hypothetical protein